MTNTCIDIPYSVVFRSVDILRGGGDNGTLAYKEVVKARTDSLSSLNPDPPALLYNLDDKSQDYAKRILNTRYNGEGTSTSYDRVDSAYRGHFIGDTDDFKEIPLYNTSNGMNDIIRGRGNMYEMYANRETDSSVPTVPVTGDYLQNRTLSAQTVGAGRLEYSDNLLGLRPMRQLPPSAGQRTGHYNDRDEGWLGYIDNYLDVRVKGPVSADSGLVAILGRDGGEGVSASPLADYGEFNRARLAATFRRLHIRIDDDSLDDGSLYSTIKGHPVLNAISKLSLAYSPQEIEEILSAAGGGEVLRRSAGLATQPSVATLQVAEQLNSLVRESLRVGGVRASSRQSVSRDVRHDIPFSVNSYVSTVRSQGAGGLRRQHIPGEHEWGPLTISGHAAPHLRTTMGGRHSTGAECARYTETPRSLGELHAAEMAYRGLPPSALTSVSDGARMSVHTGGALVGSGISEPSEAVQRRVPSQRGGPLPRMVVWGPHQEF